MKKIKVARKPTKKPNSMLKRIQTIKRNQKLRNILRKATILGLSATALTVFLAKKPVRPIIIKSRVKSERVEVLKEFFQTPVLRNALKLPANAFIPTNEILKLNKKERIELINLIAVYAASINGVRPELVKQIIQNESSYRIKVVSDKGAKGLMQLMPSVIKDAREKYFLPEEFNKDEVFHPVVNILWGTEHFSELLERFNGSEEKALAAYYAGAKGTREHLKKHGYHSGQVRKYLENYGIKALNPKQVKARRTRKQRI
ncbi:MAG: transglycosylase SLT domain-containing protein [archaeon]